MTDKRRHIRVGLFAAVTVGLIALVLIVFGGLKFWKHHDHYYVEFADGVLGLKPGAEVSVNGIPVGSVDDIAIAPADLRRVRVDITVDQGTPVRADTRAFLSMAGVTGLRAIDLKGGSLHAAAIAPGGTIAAGEATLDKLEKRAEMLADQTGQLMNRANKIVDGADRVMANLSAATDPRAMLAILESTRAASANLADASVGVKAMVAESRASVKRSLDSVTAAANSASSIMDDQLAGLVVNANGLLVDLRGVIHRNEAVVQSALADMRQASRTFKDLAREVRERPSRLLFSASQPERELP